MDLHTGHPFWPIRDGLIASYPRLTRNERTDIAVIGGGISAALIAYELTMAGADVVIVDKRDVLTGSSAATTGLLLYETDSSLSELMTHVGEQSAVRAWRLGLEAIDRIEVLCRVLPPSLNEVGVADVSGFSRRPSLYLASRRADLKALEREYRLRRLHGFDVEWLDRRDLRERYGFRAPAAIYSRGDGEIDCYRFGHRLLAAAYHNGARIYDRTEVTQVRDGKSDVVLQTDSGATIRARRIVYAAGYETARYLRQKTGRLTSTWAFVSEPIPSFPDWEDHCLIWETARPYLYMRITDDGRVLAGGEDEPFSKSHEDLTRLGRKAERLLARTRAMFPDLPIEIAYRWAGVFASTEDGLPFIGETREHPSAWFALGYGGNGITFSAIAADLIRESYLGRPTADAAIFSFARRSRRGLLTRLLRR
jgi:glycine/D-amino acid oxidase-like deaminating enzyme